MISAPPGVNSQPTRQLVDHRNRDESASTLDESASTLEISINGEGYRVQVGHTVATLLEELSLHSGAVVVERNREILRRENHGEVEIVQGDKLELVHFVGGG